MEFWTRQPYGSSGNTLREIYARLNRAFDHIMPLLLSYSDHIRWDDINQTDQPIGYVNIVLNQPDYKVATDGNALDIINITRVRIYTSASSTTYVELEQMFINDERALEAMSPSLIPAGTPSHFLEFNNVIYLFPRPNYASTSGLELFFERQQVIFTSTGTSASVTTKPGIPSPFHELLALYAAQDWIMVNRSDDVNTIKNIQNRIDKKEQALFDVISMKNRTKARLGRIRVVGVGSQSGVLNNQGTDSSR